MGGNYRRGKRRKDRHIEHKGDLNSLAVCTSQEGFPRRKVGVEVLCIVYINPPSFHR